MLEFGLLHKSATLSDGTQKKLITSVAESSASLYEPCPYFYSAVKAAPFHATKQVRKQNST